MKQKIPLQQAQSLASRIVTEIAPYCERVQVAGSIRRHKAQVGDIEIVCIPKRQKNLFGEPGASILDIALENLVSAGRLKRSRANGENYKQFTIPANGVQLDLFITTPEQWPVIFAIRTGGAEFSRKLVTSRKHGGLLPTHLNVSGGFVWENEQRVDPQPATEKAFLELCGGWVEPEARQ